MNCGQIYKIANRLIKWYGTSNPFELCAHMGVNVRYADLGALKGMYKYIKRNYFIVISNKLSAQIQLLVCCHELCHHILHRDVLKNAMLWDNMLFDKSTGIEQEANMLAAEILMSDEEVCELVMNGKSAGEIAAILETSVDFVKLKAYCMKMRGYDFKGDFAVNPNFLSGKI